MDACEQLVSPWSDSSHLPPVSLPRRNGLHPQLVGESNPLHSCPVTTHTVQDKQEEKAHLHDDRYHNNK